MTETYYWIADVQKPDQNQLKVVEIIENGDNQLEVEYRFQDKNKYKFYVIIKSQSSIQPPTIEDEDEILDWNLMDELEYPFFLKSTMPYEINKKRKLSQQSSVSVEKKPLQNSQNDIISNIESQMKMDALSYASNIKNELIQENLKKQSKNQKQCIEIIDSDEDDQVIFVSSSKNMAKIDPAFEEHKEQCAVQEKKVLKFSPSINVDFFIGLIQKSVNFRVQQSELMKKSHLEFEQKQLLNTQIPSITQEQAKILQYIKGSQRKIKLVLDLDETLLNAYTYDSTVEKGKKLFKINLLIGVQNIEVDEVFRKTIKLQNQSNVLECQLAIRPGLKEFLHELKPYYDFYLYSHGLAFYVISVLDKVLDPYKSFFSRENMFINTGDINASTQKDIFKIFRDKNDPNINLRDIVIMDDIYDVWDKGQQANIIQSKKFIPISQNLIDRQVQQYSFERLGLLKPDMKQYYIETQARQDQKSQLNYVKKFLIDLSTEYYNSKIQSKIPDVRYLLQQSKIKILSGVFIVITVPESSFELLNLITELSKYMGANVFQFNKQQFEQGLFPNDCVYAVHKSGNQYELKDVFSNSNLQKVDCQWMIDCYFNLCKLEIEKYLIN